jgi:hypothetical protein
MAALLGAGPSSYCIHTQVVKARRQRHTSKGNSFSSYGPALAAL